MKVIKRDGQIVDYSPDKIELAIEKANAEVPEEEKASPIQVKNIIKYKFKRLLKITNFMFADCNSLITLNFFNYKSFFNNFFF